MIFILNFNLWTRVSWKSTRGNKALTKWLFCELEELWLNRCGQAQRFDNRPVGNLAGLAQDPNLKPPRFCLHSTSCGEQCRVMVCVGLSGARSSRDFQLGSSGAVHPTQQI